MNHSKCFDYRHPFHCFNRSPSVTVKIFIEKPLGIAHKQRFGKMSTQPHLAFSSWIEKTMTKTIHYHWENRFVLQKYGAVQKFYQRF